MSNPFLTQFNTPYNAVPFDKIKLSDYKPAIEEGIKQGKAEIEEIKTNPKAPDFYNTIEKLEQAGDVLNKVATVFFNLNSAETSDEMQQLAQEISPLLSAYSDEITMDDKLFSKINTVYQNIDKENLTDEQLFLLKKTYRSFVRNGSQLDNSKKKELMEINQELSQLSLKFGENVLKETKSFELFLSKDEELAGLPDYVLEAAKAAAKEKGHDNEYLFTLDYPSYIPFMKYSENRELREKLYYAFGSKAFQNNEYNNEMVVKKIVSLRNKKANILGYKTFSDYVLEERMAKNPANVLSLLNELLDKSISHAKKDIEDVNELSKKLNGPDAIRQWDFSYYSEKLKMERFNIDDSKLKPYFKLENVVDGVFETATKLYEISFKKKTDIPVYHKDVEVFEVLDKDGSHLALLYADFFPRAGKRNGAWMTSYQEQSNYNGTNIRPHVSVVCNFTKPTDSKPSLLTFNEVTTLFHEFGHALHGILSDGYYESLSGTNVYWDFVELPSQIMENWCYEKKCLDLFAKHYETNEPIPFEFVEKIKDSSKFLGGYQTIRQVSFGLLDMTWHSSNVNEKTSVEEFEREAMKKTSLFPKTQGVNMSCSFSHVFQGGYASGYYSYKWAEVIEADAFAYFKEEGIFNKAVASRFRDCILSKGGSKDPMELYKDFRGREPKIDALLEKSGIK
jgi:peptidyl-dipeptidase Dcp